MADDEPADPEGQETAEGEAQGPEAEPGPDDIATAPHDLRGWAEEEARRRRRTLGGLLKVRRQKAGEVELALEQSVTTIGRDPGCDIVISDPEVSRKHAQVGRTAAGYFELKDLGSRNGTRVGGRAVRRMTLLDGDSFQIGHARFTLHTVEEAAAE